MVPGIRQSGEARVHGASADLPVRRDDGGPVLDRYLAGREHLRPALARERGLAGCSQVAGPISMSASLPAIRRPGLRSGPTRHRRTHLTAHEHALHVRELEQWGRWGSNPRPADYEPDASPPHLPRPALTVLPSRQDLPGPPVSRESHWHGHWHRPRRHLRVRAPIPAAPAIGTADSARLTSAQENAPTPRTSKAHAVRSPRAHLACRSVQARAARPARPNGQHVRHRHLGTLRFSVPPASRLTLRMGRLGPARRGPSGRRRTGWARRTAPAGLR